MASNSVSTKIELRVWSRKQDSWSHQLIRWWFVCCTNIHSFNLMQICNEHSNCCPCRYKTSHSAGALSHNNVPVLYLQSAGHVIGCSVDKALPWALARIRVLCAASLPPAARESLFGATQHLAFQASEMRILNPNCLLQHLPLIQSSPFILLVN